jgi:hypothetical protein
MARLAKEQIATTAPVVDLRGRGVGGSPLTALQDHQINVLGQPSAKPLTCPTHDVPSSPEFILSWLRPIGCLMQINRPARLAD